MVSESDLNGVFRARLPDASEEWPATPERDDRGALQKRYSSNGPARRFAEAPRYSVAFVLL